MGGGMIGGGCIIGFNTAQIGSAQITVGSGGIMHDAAHGICRDGNMWSFSPELLLGHRVVRGILELCQQGPHLPDGQNHGAKHHFLPA